jgi:hypothetical protein
VILRFDLGRRMPKPPNPNDYALLEEQGQQTFAFVGPRPKRTPLRGRAKALVNQAAFKLSVELETLKTVGTRDRQLPLPSIPTSAHRKITAFEVAWLTASLLILPAVLYHEVFGTPVPELNFYIFKFTNVPKVVVSGSLGVLATVAGVCTLLGSILWAHRNIPHAHSAASGLARWAAILLIGLIAVVPSFASVALTYRPAAYVVRSAVQNVINVFTLPEWPEPEVKR